MPVTLATPLPAIAFSKNTILLQLVSDDYRATAPAIAINYIEFSAAIADTDTIEISWQDNGVIMTAIAADPDGSGNQFPAGDGSAAYVTSIVDYFQENYIIGNYFDVSADTSGPNPRLIFTAIAPGADFTFNTGTVSGNITPGADDAALSNFMHHLEIWIANLSGTYIKGFDANLPLDEPPLTGFTSADIHEILHSFLSQPGEFDKPVLDPHGLYQQYTSSLRPYYIKFAQFFGEVPSVQKVIKTDIRYIAKGGLSEENANMRDIVSELCPVAENAAKNRFLRQGSKNKLVAKDQPEWLTFINLTPGAIAATLEVKVFNADATSITFTPVTALSIAAYQKFQFQVGFNMLNITVQQSVDETPIYYTARLKNAADQYITDTYAFVIDNQYREWPRYFVYENSYGAYQTIATVGKGQDEFDRKKIDAQLAMTRNEAAIDGDFIETNITIQDKATVSIGYDRAGSRNTTLLRDLMLSHCIYLYKNGVLIPIGVNTTNLKDAMDGTNVYANSFEYYPKYEEEVYTEPAGLADDSVAALLAEAGSPNPYAQPGAASSGNITVEYNDSHLSIVADQQTYTAPALIGLGGYRIYTTQMGVYFRTADIAYDDGAGSFTILVPGFTLNPGDQLIIWPYILNPES